MKKLVSVLLFVLILQMNTFVYASVNIMMGNNITDNGEQKPVTNPLQVQLVEGLDSKTAVKKKITKVPVMVVKTTTINGSKYSVGNEGYLNISEKERSHNFGKGGRLVISHGKIKDNNGKEHYFQYKEVITGDDHRMTQILTGVGVFFWPLLFCCFKNGDEAVANKDSILVVSVLE